MIIDLGIRCFNRTKKDFFDRNLVLDIDTLDPVTRSRIELCMSQRNSYEREILKYRHLFREKEQQTATSDFSWNSYHCISVTDYIEDEDGKEISVRDIIRIKEGRDNIVVFPPHYRSHDMVLSLSDNSPIPENPQEHIKLSQVDIDALAYYVKDVYELKENAFYRTPPTFTSCGNTFSVKTVTVEHIVAYLTIFRRLFMEQETGNYNKACAIYARHFLNKRLTNWITAERRLYNKFLATKTKSFGFLGNELSFTNRTLIQNMLTIRFAHQPKDDLREKHELFIRELGDQTHLEWVFYFAVHEVSLYYSRAHGFISNELNWYLKATGKSPTFNFAPFLNQMGRGEQLTAEQAREQAIHNQATKLARELWEEAGKPDGQLERFIKVAEDKLRE